jgi:pantoate--beta-alanine ligase
MTELIHDPVAYRAGCDAARARGLVVGVVPTMGALREGHLALVTEAQKRAQLVAVTIFVNPMQFGPNEDYGRYPRTLPEDLERCRAHGVDLVFAPAAEDMYPPGFSSYVGVDGVTEPLEGAFRPGHFRGVTTVVAKLLNLTGPSVAVFGRKDYQQWKTLARMVGDLNMPIDVIGMPTVREPDGLALSSRNRYLSAEEREGALAIARGLRAANAAFISGERRATVLEGLARAPVERAFDSIDYVAARDPETLAELGEAPPRVVIVVAARIGKTRLIDNAVLGEDAL